MSTKASGWALAISGEIGELDAIVDEHRIRGRRRLISRRIALPQKVSATAEAFTDTQANELLIFLNVIDLLSAWLQQSEHEMQWFLGIVAFVAASFLALWRHRNISK
jgi:hypothetical protein